MDFHDMFNESEEDRIARVNKLIKLYGNYVGLSQPAIDAYSSRPIEFFTHCKDNEIGHFTVYAEGEITAYLSGDYK